MSIKESRLLTCRYPVQWPPRCGCGLWFSRRPSALRSPRRWPSAPRRPGGSRWWCTRSSRGRSRTATVTAPETWEVRGPSDMVEITNPMLLKTTCLEGSRSPRLLVSHKTSDNFQYPEVYPSWTDYPKSVVDFKKKKIPSNFTEQNFDITKMLPKLKS